MHRVSANGADIPALGFGTWRLDGEVARRMVETALELGYRHVDTAQMYGNEAEVGAAVRASGLPREEVFVTTKIWPDDFRADDLERAVERSLDRLKLGWIDLLLLHWPNPAVPLVETFPALEAAKERGVVKHVGVSNFTVGLMAEALRVARVPIATNQVEYHPFLSQQALLPRLRAAGIALTAYCPLARGRVQDDAVLARIGRAHGRTPAQVALRWLIQQDGVIAIPRSSRPEHARTNLAVFDFELSPSEIAEITALGTAAGRIGKPDFAPAWDKV